MTTTTKLTKTFSLCLCFLAAACSVAGEGAPEISSEVLVPEPVVVPRNRTAEELEGIKARLCSNDAAPAEVKGKAPPEARDAKVRYPAEQKEALVKQLSAVAWVPPPVSPAMVALQQRYVAETASLPAAERAARKRELVGTDPQLDRGLTP